MNYIEIKNFFNKASEYWNDRIEHNHNKIREYLSYINIREKQQILDVGTGTGIMLDFLLPELTDKAEITAVDISPGMLEKARSNYTDSRVCFREVNVETDNLPRDHYDLVIMYSVFPHLEFKKQTLSTLISSMKQNGELCIMHSKSREEINNMHKSLGPPVSSHMLPPVSELKQLAEHQGKLSQRTVETLVAKSEDTGYLYLAKVH